MKCKRCGAEMRRIKRADHAYSYRCPRCGHEVKAVNVPKEANAGRAGN